jgi:hypothetical protein
MVIDFHEGWGWHLETKDSKNLFPQTSEGSTLTLGKKFSKDLAQKIIDKLNPDIKDDKRRFSLRGDNCNLPSSLGCYMDHNDRPYVLVETTGQEDIQPMDVRERQIRTIISTVLKDLGI